MVDLAWLAPLRERVKLAKQVVLFLLFLLFSSDCLFLAAADLHPVLRAVAEQQGEGVAAAERGLGGAGDRRGHYGGAGGGCAAG